MFTTISPKNRNEKKELLSRVIDTREGFFKSGKDAFDTESTIYIAYENKPYGVLASARLNLLRDSPAKKIYDTLYSQAGVENMREMSLVSFEMEEGHWAQEHLSIFKNTMGVFYQGLYEVLINISLSLGVSRVTTFVHEEEHGDLCFFGRWNFHSYRKLTVQKSSFVLGEVHLPQRQPFFNKESFLRV